MKKIIAIVAIAAAPLLFAQNKISTSTGATTSEKTVKTNDSAQELKAQEIEKMKTEELKKAETERLMIEKKKASEDKAVQEKRLKTNNSATLKPVSASATDERAAKRRPE